MIRNILIIMGVLFIAMVVDAATIREEQALTVLVTNEGFTGGGRGSGLILDATHILTCAHMVHSRTDEFFVYTYPLGSVIRAHVEYGNANMDLAILVLEKPIVLVAYPRFEHHYTEGDPVTVVGNALGAMKWLVSKGVISGQEGQYLITDAHVNHGNSGGPWFDADGSVLAISDWLIQPESGPGVSGGISAATIEDFLAEREAAKTMAEMLGHLMGA